tara:strand:+ start:233 stop:466 length:234 start_codon:yes stop_codon:yes gene_type:complete
MKKRWQQQRRQQQQQQQQQHLSKSRTTEGGMFGFLCNARFGTERKRQQRTKLHLKEARFYAYLSMHSSIKPRSGVDG